MVIADAYLWDSKVKSNSQRKRQELAPTLAPIFRTSTQIAENPVRCIKHRSGLRMLYDIL